MFENFIPCTDAVANLWGIADTTIAPALLFYAYIPVVIVSLLLGFYVLRKGSKILLNRLFFWIAISFSAWVIGIIGQWIFVFANSVHLLWQLTAFFEVPVFLLTIYFVYVYLWGPGVTKKLWPFFAAIMAPVIILLPTTLNITSFDLVYCEGVVGPLWTYIYIFEAVAVLWIACAAILFSKQQRHGSGKKMAGLLISIGAMVFLALFFLSNLFGEITQVYSINLYGPIGLVVFLSLVGYSVVKFRVFNMKLFGAQLLVAALLIILGSILFVQHIENVRLILIPSLVLIAILGFILVRSVRREIEQREKLEELTKELSTANDELRKLDEFRRQVLSFASHDLKSPIALMKQWASLIYDGTYKEPEKVKDTVFKIKMTADRAVNMVDNFLDIRKMEEGNMAYNFETANIVEFTRSITKDFEILGKIKDIGVSFESKAAEIPVSIDKNTMRQVLQNLLDNSLKYTESGFIAVSLTEEQKSILIKIQDTGVGMNPEILPTLFEQFHRDPGVAKKIKGTGLGLYISKQIVIAHHGEIWVESDGEGKGSRFFIRLPKA